MWTCVRLLVGMMLLAGLCIVPAPAEAAARFGTRCQSDFQHDWQNTLPYVWNRCGWFNEELDTTDTKVFYFNLHGSSAPHSFSTCDSCGEGADNVRLYYVSTHGGALDRADAVLAMWNDNVLAASIADGWRFGDESTRAAFMAFYACETLTNGDENIWSRWRSAFRGGLLMALGSHDKLFDGLTTDETGQDFADGLQKGKAVKWAWFDGNGDWWTDQDVAVMATGSDEAGDATDNCRSRRNGVKWQNFGGFSRWRDGEVNRWCRSKIDNN